MNEEEKKQIYRLLRISPYAIVVACILFLFSWGMDVSMRDSMDSSKHKYYSCVTKFPSKSIHQMYETFVSLDDKRVAIMYPRDTPNHGVEPSPVPKNPKSVDPPPNWSYLYPTGPIFNVYHCSDLTSF